MMSLTDWLEDDNAVKSRLILFLVFLLQICTKFW